MRTIIQLVLAASLLTGCFVDATSDALREVGTLQEPLVTYNPPADWGPGVRAYVGRRPTNQDILLFYKQGLSGAGTCSAAAVIGDNGVLFDRTRVNGTGGADEMYVAAIGEDVPKAPCFGLTLVAINTSIKLELWAGDGDDVIQALGINSNLIAKGEAGTDFVAVGSAFHAGGGLGPNVMISTASESVLSTTIQGGANNDTMCAYMPATVIGDSGTDQWWAPGSEVFSAETPTTQAACDFWVNAVDARMDD